MRSIIKLDFNNMLLPVNKYGFKPPVLKIGRVSELIPRAAEKLKAIQNNPELRITKGLEWLELPFQPRKLLIQIEQLADRFAGRFENILSLGIGGSFLGNQMLHEVLKSPYYNEFSSLRKGRPRMYFAGNNVDPETLGIFLDNLNLAETGVVVISKSGETTETKAAFEIVKERLKKAVGKKFNRHIIAVTDAKKGSLRAEVEKLGYESFVVPEGVGGRWSVLSPVGLVTAAIEGTNINELLAGAAVMNAKCIFPDIWKNPAYMYATLQYLAGKTGKKNISVLMPFADSLKSLAEWYVQLKAESLGKKYSRVGIVINAGQTPIPSVGTTDLHSTMQLNIEGPYDKIITFIKVEKFRKDLSLPTLKGDFLSGKSLTKLMHTALEGTEWALTREGRLNSTLIMPEINEFYLGQLIFFFELATAFEGELLDINAYDQPGVESYKNYMYVKLGKSVPPKIKREVEKQPLSKDNRFII